MRLRRLRVVPDFPDDFDFDFADFAAAGIEGEPQKTVEAAAEAAFRARYGDPAAPDAAWTTALTKTQAELLPLTANRMHLTEEGGLVVAVELFAPEGGSRVEALRLP